MKRWLTLGLCLVAMRAFAAPSDQVVQAAYGGDIQAAEQVYVQFKHDGTTIPGWLDEMMNPPAKGGGEGSQRQGGENPASAVVIPSLPYTDSGTTTGYVSDASNFAGPDVFYSLTVAATTQINASLCGGSTWDTGLSIFIDAGGVMGALVASNDDGCSLQSVLTNVTLVAGSYYVVVDGYSTNNGPYTLNVSVWVDPCIAYTANISSLTAPGTATGTTVGMPNVYAGTSGDQGINITIPSAGEWNFDSCVAGTGYADDLYLFTASPCAGGTLIASNTSATCAVFTNAARLLNVGLQPGTYHLLVGNSSAGAGTEGAFAISVYATSPSRPTSGGPDAFGYVWRNSLDPTGPAYGWVEIAPPAGGPGTPITLASGSSVAGPFALGMSFPFYEANYTNFYVSSEGFLSFNALASSYLTNATIPTAALPQNIVAGFWDDLSFTAGVGQAFYYWDAGNSRFILEFRNFYKTSSTNLVTFEIILFQNGNVQVQYQNLPEILQNSATLGIEDLAGTRGVLVNYNNTGGALFDGVATLFTRPVGDVVGPGIIHTPLGNTENLGPYTVNADISDLDNAVASATLFYQVNGGGYISLAMTAGTPPAYAADIPAQAASSTVAYYLQAVDTASPANTTTSPTWSFRVQDYTLPPSGLTASDGVLDQVNVAWSAPVWLALAAPGPEPRFEDFLPLHGGKDVAWNAFQTAHAAWLAAQVPAERSFLTYNVYRDGGLIGTSATTAYTDIPPDLASHDYHVTALFDAGESAASNIDAGFMTARPTSGGPDGFGYVWANSLDPSGPTYGWVDISGTGTLIAAPSDDGFTGPYALGFSLPFYLNSYTDVYVNSNGHLTFGAGGGSLTNQNMPNVSTPNNVMAPFWDDLAPHYVGATIHYLADVPNSRFIVQYHVPAYGSVSPYTFYDFQAILTPDGNVVYNFLNVVETDVAQASIGIENIDGTIGLTANFDNAGGRIADGLAYQFTYPVGDWIGPVIVHTPLADTEADGPYTVSADITDEDSNVASATLYYQVNGGGYLSVAMVAGTPPAWTADIPDQTPLAVVDYYILALDDSPQANDTTSPTWSFDVVDYTWPPVGLTASDGVLGEVDLAWSAPAPPAPLASAAPVVKLPTLEQLIISGMSKEAAWSWLQQQQALQDAGRSFITYNVYRDGGLIGTSNTTSYVDIPPSTAVYTYHVTALFDAGESNPSNTDTGFMGVRPTSGGPDAFGYVWMNSDDPSGQVTFAWTDISTDPNAVALALGDDASSTLLSLGFTFSFYGANQTDIYVNSNGILTFGAGSTDYNFSEVPIPTAGAPNNLVAPFWDDMYLPGGGTLHYLADAGNQRFTAQWTGVPHFGQPATDTYTYQVVLQGDGQIFYRYFDMNGIRNSATVGIEDAAGTVGLQVNHIDAGGRIGDSVAVRIRVTPPCETPANMAIAMAAGDANLTWDAVAGALSYNVFGATDGYGPFVLLGNVATNAFTDVGAQLAGRKFYQVTTVCP